MSDGVFPRPFAAALLCTALASSILHADPLAIHQTPRTDGGPGGGEADGAGRGRLPAVEGRFALFTAETSSFPLRLDDRLRREARRFPDLLGPAIEAGPETDSEPDDGTRAARSRRVGRLLTRAVRGALDDHLTERARESGALPGIFRLLEARSDGAIDRGPADPGAAAGAGASGAPPSFRTTFRLRLDAHPRLQLRARMGPLTGSIEVPVIDPELRVGLESRIGSTGRAALQGGHSDERGGWASFGLNFSF